MSWKLHDKEFESVLSLPGNRRYEYFIKKVADWKQLWSLSTNAGWVLVADERGQEAVPVWPHERFAEACAIENWGGANTRLIELSAWMERWIPGMIAQGRQVGVFPTPSEKGVLVLPDRMKRDLEQEISLME